MKYSPHDYQEYAADFIVKNPIAAILLDMGMGKSVITLTAIHELMYELFEVQNVLIIAPLRVAKNTWPAEIEKWDHLKGTDVFHSGWNSGGEGRGTESRSGYYDYQPRECFMAD
jgi:superfamily II DNA or RNA helicase